MANEVGKVLQDGLGEVDKCIKYVNYYIENTFSFIEDEELKSSYPEAYATHQPLGVVLGIHYYIFNILIQQSHLGIFLSG